MQILFRQLVPSGVARWRKVERGHKPACAATFESAWTRATAAPFSYTIGSNAHLMKINFIHALLHVFIESNVMISV